MTRTNVFGSRELPHGSLVMVASSKDHIVFRIGPWTIAFASRRRPSIRTSTR